MAGPASLFREIHRLRRFARDLQEQLDRIPRQRKAYQAKLAKQEQAFRDEQEAVKRLKVTASDKEKQLKGKGELLERYGRQMNEVTSKKEHDALMLEMAHAREVCAKLEDEILQAMSEGEERQARLPEEEKALAQVRAEVDRFESEAGARKATLEGELAKALAQLKSAEEQIPRDLRPQYDRTVASKGADGFAVVRNRTCSECYTEINRTIELRLLNDDFAVCPSCGRILYLPEEAAKAKGEGE
jgi:predicted  nucleic acid-binding Zn-ribbon protein